MGAMRRDCMGFDGMALDGMEIGWDQDTMLERDGAGWDKTNREDERAQHETSTIAYKDRLGLQVAVGDTMSVQV